MMLSWSPQIITQAMTRLTVCLDRELFLSRVPRNPKILRVPLNIQITLKQAQ